MIKKHLALWLISLTMVISPLLAVQEQDITAFMQSNIDTATSVLRNNQLSKAEKSSKIFAIFDTIFDYTLMAKLAISGNI